MEGISSKTPLKDVKNVSSSPSTSRKGSRPTSGQKSSRPQSTKTKSKSASSSRPLSAASTKDSSSRPTSAVPQNPTIIAALKDVDRDIRKIVRQMKVLQREKVLKELRAAAAAATEKKEESSRPTTSKSKDAPSTDTELVIDGTSVDPLLDLEDQKKKLIAKYESMLPAGGKYECSPEGLLYDFCMIFFDEFHQPAADRSFEYLLKYYDPEASLNIIGFKTFQGRENIVNVLLKRYEGLRIRYYFQEVMADPEPIRGSILSGTVKLSITIDNDTPRKVMQMFQFVRSLEPNTPFDYVIAKEYFLVQDARPLYHFAEEPPRLSSLQLEYLRIMEQRRLQAEEEARRKELEENESYDEGEEGEENSLGEGSRSILSGIPPEGGEEKKGEEVEEKGREEEDKNNELNEEKSLDP